MAGVLHTERHHQALGLQYQIQSLITRHPESQMLWTVHALSFVHDDQYDWVQGAEDNSAA